MSEENGKSQWQREMEQWQTRFREQMDEMNRMYIKHNTEWEERFARSEKIARQSEERTKKQFDYLAKLTGVAFEQMNEFGEQIEQAGKTLRHK
ncbi:MAG: hypothetical protein M3525_08340 [Acidobacteriota bacterium]|nr:hypothetical protein [Acidobacteriota bacterium]